MGNLPEIGNLFREFSVLSATTADFVGEDEEVDDKVFPPELMNLFGACCMWYPLEAPFFLHDFQDVNMPGVVTGEKLAALVASSDIFFSPTVTGTVCWDGEST